MQQIQQLQKTVMQLQAGGAGAGAGAGAGFTPGTGGFSDYREQQTGEQQGRSTWSNKPVKEEEGINELEQTVLLVSNIPPNLSNPESLYYAFEKFGTVQKVKILHNKRNTALIQMSQPEEAQKAIGEQEKLNRVGTDIYVNFSSKFREIRMPEPGSRFDEGLAKDFTGDTSGPSFMQGGGVGLGRGGGLGEPGLGWGGGGGHYRQYGEPHHQQWGRGGAGGGQQDYGYAPNFSRQGGGGGGGGIVLLVSNIPDEIAKVDQIFNMIGMYGDVMAVKILHNKRDCCLVQMAKPHHAQQVRQFLDQAKVGGKKLCISFSHLETIQLKRHDDGDNELQKDFLNSRSHRYRNQATAAKLTKNLAPPSSTLHVANLPEGMTHSEVKVSRR